MVLVQFNLPTIPAGCTFSSATLELFAETVTAGRTMNVSRAATIWSNPSVHAEATNPRRRAPPWVSRTAGTGWESWAVTSLVQSQYAGPNYGFVVQDSVESQPGVRSCRSSAARSTTSPEKPKLTVSWELSHLPFASRVRLEPAQPQAVPDDEHR